MTTMIIAAILAVIVFFAARSVYRQSKKGGCAGGCAGCSCHCSEKKQ